MVDAEGKGVLRGERLRGLLEGLLAERSKVVSMLARGRAQGDYVGKGMRGAVWTMEIFVRRLCYEKVFIASLSTYMGFVWYLLATR